MGNEIAKLEVQEKIMQADYDVSAYNNQILQNNKRLLGIKREVITLEHSNDKLKSAVNDAMIRKNKYEAELEQLEIQEIQM
jgi:hypothetical protein